MQVQDIMSRPVRSVSSSDTIGFAATLMASADIGALPVVDEGRLVGIVTDRDLAVRGLAAGLDGAASLLQVITRDVVACAPDDEFAAALRSMAEAQVRRIPVRAPGGEVIGMVSIGDAARSDEYCCEAVETLSAISRRDGRHCQSREALILA